MIVSSNQIRADLFRDDLVMHVRKLVAIHDGAAKVFRTRREQDAALIRKAEMETFAKFLESITFPNIKPRGKGE